MYIFTREIKWTNMDNWKLKLRYGKLKTPYSHFTVMADGKTDNLNECFECPQGYAWMSMHVWATSTEQAADMMSFVSNDIGFEIREGTKILIYSTEPQKAPREEPFGYGITFTPYQAE